MTIAPTTPNDANTCYPLHSSAGAEPWQPFAAFFYRNIPSFELAPGDVLAFDGRSPDNVPDKRLVISLAATTANGNNIPATAFSQVVSNQASPAGTPGDTIHGNFELRFNVTGGFTFPGGGLIMRFSEPLGGLAADGSCNGGIQNAPSTDPSGFFLGRAFNDPDGTAPWSNDGSNFIGAFQTTSNRSCRSQVATIVGTAGADQLAGTPGADVINAGGGDDRVIAAEGNDTVCGGDGKDRLVGNQGKDVLSGEAGKDSLSGSSGKDQLLGGTGKDLLRGGPGKDKLVGGPGKDNTRQ